MYQFYKSHIVRCILISLILNLINPIHQTICPSLRSTFTIDSINQGILLSNTSHHPSISISNPLHPNHLNPPCIILKSHLSTIQNSEHPIPNNNQKGSPSNSLQSQLSPVTPSKDLLTASNPPSSGSAILSIGGIYHSIVSASQVYAPKSSKVNYPQD